MFNVLEILQNMTCFRKFYSLIWLEYRQFIVKSRKNYEDNYLVVFLGDRSVVIDLNLRQGIMRYRFRYFLVLDIEFQVLWNI